jgi:hypothetical protein
MVPAELMAAAVAMLADPLPQPFYFGNQFFPCHPVKVGVHDVLPPQQASIHDAMFGERVEAMQAKTISSSPSASYCLASMAVLKLIVSELPEISDREYPTATAPPAEQQRVLRQRLGIRGSSSS